MKLNRATISVFDRGCGLLPSPKISAMFSDLFCVQLFIVKTKLSGKKQEIWHIQHKKTSTRDEIETWRHDTGICCDDSATWSRDS